jgi:hypothetical protein
MKKRFFIVTDNINKIKIKGMCMKTKILVVFSALFLNALLNINTIRAGEVFYYNMDGGKISYTEVLDKILLRLDTTETANKEDFNNLINSISTNLSCIKFDKNGGDYRTAIVSSRNGEAIHQSILEQLKANDMVISVAYMLQGSTRLIGIINEINVRLKAEVNQEQFNQLLLQNDCRIVRKFVYTEDQYLISISETSELTAFQMSVLFYETGLFEWAEPNFAYPYAYDDPTSMPGSSHPQTQLFQNYPNPFKEQTVIKFNPTDKSNSAEIYIFDLSGKLLYRYLADDSGYVVIDASIYSPGIYIYSLVIDGKQVEQRKMLKQK